VLVRPLGKRTVSFLTEINRPSKTLSLSINTSVNSVITLASIQQKDSTQTCSGSLCFSLGLIALFCLYPFAKYDGKFSHAPEGGDRSCLKF